MYCNRGLFVDIGVLTHKPESQEQGPKGSGSRLPMFKAGDKVNMELSAITLMLIDKLYNIVLEWMNSVHLSMA
jgi:hypothetical protein